MWLLYLVEILRRFTSYLLALMEFTSVCGYDCSCDVFLGTIRMDEHHIGMLFYGIFHSAYSRIDAFCFLHYFPPGKSIRI